MARFSVLIFALVLAFSSADGWAKDKNGRYFSHGNQTCGYYLDAYSRSRLEGREVMMGPPAFSMVFGWISGALSTYNKLSHNGKKSILGSMTLNDAMRWIAAWCRDNPSKRVNNAIVTLIDKLER